MKKEQGNCILCQAFGDLEGTVCGICYKDYEIATRPFFQDKAGQEYGIATDVKIIADYLIPQFHPHLVEGNIKIEYVFTKNQLKTGSKNILGRVRKITGLNSWLAKEQESDDATPFFLMEISFPSWELMKPSAKVALVDHELCHCGWDAQKNQICLIPHDIEEHRPIVQRHGFWQDDVLDFLKVVKDAEANPLFAEQIQEVTK